MPIDLIRRRIEERILLLRTRGHDVLRGDNPDAHALAPSSVDVPGIAQGHRRVGGMNAPGMHVGQPTPGPDEDFPQRPLRRGRHHAAVRCPCLAAYAAAASRTHAPAVYASIR